MTPALLYAAAGAALLAVGLFGVIAGEGAIRRVLAVNVMGTGVFLLLVALAVRLPARAPDPVLHAMVLTGIVVAVSATALAIVLACRLDAPAEADGHGGGEET